MYVTLRTKLGVTFRVEVNANNFRIGVAKKNGRDRATIERARRLVAAEVRYELYQDMA